MCVWWCVGWSPPRTHVRTHARTHACAHTRPQTANNNNFNSKTNANKQSHQLFNPVGLGVVRASIGHPAHGVSWCTRTAAVVVPAEASSSTAAPVNFCALQHRARFAFKCVIVVRKVVAATRSINAGDGGDRSNATHHYFLLLLLLLLLPLATAATSCAGCP